jgi:hypothetical protein
MNMNNVGNCDCNDMFMSIMIVKGVVLDAVDWINLDKVKDH